MATEIAISGLTALGGAPAVGDELVIVDISDTTQAPTGTTKNMTVANLFTSPSIATPTITGTATITGGTVTTSAPIINGTQTWNAPGVPFTGWKLNVTDTASAAASLLADLQVGGTTKFSVGKSGTVTVAGAVTGSAITVEKVIDLTTTSDNAGVAITRHGTVSTSVETYLAFYGYNAAAVGIKVMSVSSVMADTANATGYNVLRINSTYQSASVQTDDIFLAGFGGHGAVFWPADSTTASAPGANVLRIKGQLDIPTVTNAATFGTTTANTPLTLQAANGSNQWRLLNAASTPAASASLSGGGVDLTFTVNAKSFTHQADGITDLPGAVIIRSATATALAVGPNGTTTPVLTVDASTASVVAGLSIKGAVTGGTVAIVATDSGSNTNLTINGKGSGTIGIGSVSTGQVTITPATKIVAGFGCNNAAPQTPVSSGGALNAYAGGVNGLDTGANMSALHALVVQIRLALVANGVMS